MQVPKLMFRGSAFTKIGLAVADRAIVLSPEQRISKPDGDHQEQHQTSHDAHTLPVSWFAI